MRITVLEHVATVLRALRSPSAYVSALVLKRRQRVEWALRTLATHGWEPTRSAPPSSV